MITKPKLAHGATPAECQSRRYGVYGMTNQKYLYLLVWVIFVIAVTDGLAAIAFHVW